MPLGRKSPTSIPDHDLLEHLQEDWPQPVLPPQSRSSAPRRSASTAVSSRGSAQQFRAPDWTDRLVAEGFMLLIWTGVWVLNAFFTIEGLAKLGVPWILGLLIHAGISKGEQHLWKGGLDPIVLMAVAVCMLVDVGTTLMGLVDTLALRSPMLLGDTPADLGQWQALVITPRPAWWPGAIVLFVLAIVIALCSEYMIKKFWRRFQAVWNG